MNSARGRIASAVYGAAVSCLIAASAALSLVAVAQQSGAPPTGNVERGRTLFTTAYKCYACHGYDAQTGERRLVPMNYTQEVFATFVQNSPLPQMPAYPDMSAQALADVYAYIQSIPIDAPDVEDLPLLQDVLDRKMNAFAK